MRVCALLLIAVAAASGQVALGKKLFFDKRLSADGSVACATCHDPAKAFADGRPLSVGVGAKTGPRHTPTLVGRGFGTLQFWDGRAASLQDQVVQPIANPVEMGSSVEEALTRLKPDYPDLNPASLAAALASYVATIRSTGSPLDRYLGGETSALSTLEQKGLALFRDKARCYICHSGDHFTDEQFHNTGVSWTGSKLADGGRAAITGKPYHRGAFKTPTLREIASRAPYMHDGSLATLEDVVEFYDRGCKPNLALDENIVPLHLTAEEKQAIVAFLKALSGRVLDGS